MTEPNEPTAETNDTGAGGSDTDGLQPPPDDKSWLQFDGIRNDELSIETRQMIDVEQRHSEKRE